MDDPRKSKLRRAIKEMALASSGKVLRGEAIFNLVHVLHERYIFKYQRVPLYNSKPFLEIFAS
jgi:hypothetical protein